MTLILSSLSARNQLPQMMKQSAPCGVGVEVGVHRAEYLVALAQGWPEAQLYGVDPWSIPEGYENQSMMLTGWRSGPLPNRDVDYGIARDKTSCYGDRVELICGFSVEVAERFDDDSTDFVYLDGDHSREAVEADVAAWWPKIKEGGVLAGHDFVTPQIDDGGWGRFVQPVVMDHAEKFKRDVYMIVEGRGMPWSWYLFK